MKYRCLIFDHDDTTVNSTTKIHYPSFVEFMRQYRPELSFSIEEFVRYNFHPGVVPFFREICGLSEKEMEEEQEFWRAYSLDHTADAFPGIKELMEREKKEGGIIAVISHSLSENIMKDYRYNGLPEPDAVFGWEEPVEERKPSPIPVQKIMRKFSLHPEEILVIDDLKPGLDMARAAGVAFAAACWCFDIPENEAYLREHADACFHSVKELEDYCFP